MVVWKTLLIIVLGLILIIVILLLVFVVINPNTLSTKFSGLLESLDRAIKSLFDVSEWSW
jgi:uncharacterized integral membrane protein